MYMSIGVPYIHILAMLIEAFTTERVHKVVVQESSIPKSRPSREWVPRSLIASC